uniref:Uncharacterized protein n=1 Tax=Cacopsylla melanoneura TaxID=428564 RepID=A0A8D8ZVQ8_9HEMI
MSRLHDAHFYYYSPLERINCALQVLRHFAVLYKVYFSPTFIYYYYYSHASVQFSKIFSISTPLSSRSHPNPSHLSSCRSCPCPSKYLPLVVCSVSMLLSYHT